MEDGDGAFLFDRVGEGADDVLMGDAFGGGDGIAQRAAGDVGGVEIEEGRELAHESRQAAGVVEMFHVVRAGGLEVEQDGDVAA